MRVLLLVPLLAACAASHPSTTPPLPAPEDAGPHDSGAEPQDARPSAARPCEPGWTRERDQCVRWREAASYPGELCWPSEAQVGLDATGAPIVRCGALGFAYHESSDSWRPVALGPTEPPDPLAGVPGPEEPTDWQRGAPLGGQQGSLILEWTPWSTPWRAHRWRGSAVDTLDPPADLTVDAIVPLGPGRVIAAGALRSAVYERVPARR